MPDLKITELDPLLTADNPDTYFIVSLDGESLKLKLDTLKNFTESTFNIAVDEAIGVSAASIIADVQAIIDNLPIPGENDIIDAIESELSAENSTAYSLVSASALAAVSGDGTWAIASDLNALSVALGEQEVSITEKFVAYSHYDGSTGGIAQVTIDVNGNITGWTAVNDSVSGSGFLIQADYFSITDQTGNYTPFSINTDTSTLSFNGKVAFTSVTGTETLLQDITDLDLKVVEAADIADAINSNATTINGSSITTGSIGVAHITVGAISLDELLADNFDSYIAGTDVLAKWTNYNGNGEVSIVPDGISVGNNTDDDQRWLIWHSSYVWQPHTTYTMTVVAKTTQGNGKAYFGFAGRNEADDQFVNSSGNNSYASQTYFVAAGVTVPNAFTTYSGTISVPWHANVTKFRPVILVQHSNESGTTIIKSVTITKKNNVLTAGAVGALSDSTTIPSTPADVGAGTDASGTLSRMVITPTGIEIYDGNTLRVKLGAL